ncbi:sodium:proton antiporter, partial [Kingella kingae]|nr:sodium:proton antiporter [Kingella kingae]
MNAVMIGVLVMLVLSVARVHVVLSLVVGAFAGGLAAGLPLADVVNAVGEVTQKGVMTHFQNGLSGGASIALSY